MSERATTVSGAAPNRVIDWGRTRHAAAWRRQDELVAQRLAGIVPCGIGAADSTVTSLRRELGRDVDPAEVKAVLAREFWARLPKYLGGCG